MLKVHVCFWKRCLMNNLFSFLVPGEWLLTCFTLLFFWSLRAQLQFYNLTSLVSPLVSANFTIFLSGSRWKQSSPKLLFSHFWRQLPLLSLLMLLLRPQIWGPAWAPSCLFCSSGVFSCVVGCSGCLLARSRMAHWSWPFVCADLWSRNKIQTSEETGY